MMQSEIFTLHAAPARVFAFAINGSLNGEEMSQKHIREELFPSPMWDEHSSVVRRYMELVRKLIDEYYAAEGKDDLVIFALPKFQPGKRTKRPTGEAYRFQFTYNPRHEAMKQYRLGAFFSRRGTVEDLPIALEHFTNTVRLHPGNVDALIGMIWVFKTAATFSTGEERKDHLASAEYCSNVALKTFPKYWGVHFVRAALLAEQDDVASARKSLKRALKLERKATLTSARRTHLLSKLGLTDFHLNLAQAYIEESRHDPEGYIVQGTVLLSMRRFEDAIKSAEAALRLDRNSFAAHFIIACCLIHERQPSEADSHIARLEQLADEATFVKMRTLLLQIRSKLAEQA